MAGDDDDDLLIDDEDDAGQPVVKGAPAPAPLKVLIVDDDPEVHEITRIALSDVIYKERRLIYLDAYSGAEARTIMAREHDIAVVLLDVVMESDQAGLDVVRYIREVLGNNRTRIILRTGQPGRAPEREVILAYDINDYKAKTELTVQRLFTSTVAALRSYSDIMAIEMNRRGLERIVDASATLFERRSMAQFVEGVMIQLQSLIGDARGSLLCKVVGDAAADAEFRVLAGWGAFAVESGRPLREVVPPDVAEDIENSFSRRANIYSDDHCVIYFRSHSHAASVAYVSGHAPLGETDRRLLEVFCNKVAIGFDNVHLYEQLRNAQKATVVALADLAEHKDNETGDHVRRIERWTAAIAAELAAQGQFEDALTHTVQEQIGLASILHDVGKVAIPDGILQKPAKLSPEEWQVMQTHAPFGGAILRRAARMLPPGNYLSLAADIAESHHEKFDGTGYPRGLAGEDIPLSGRITAVADVYDALVSRRPYKEPWPVEKALAHIQAQAGSHFDPRVVAAFLAVHRQIG